MYHDQIRQKGSSLLEVLVALILVSLGVLGFSTLQYHAVNISLEAIYHTQAVNIARDLAERIRVNSQMLDRYIVQANQNTTQHDVIENCIGRYSLQSCTAKMFADFDIQQVKQNASNLGMFVNILPCAGDRAARHCIYVAWGKTSATNGQSMHDCTHGQTYQPASTCVVLEAY